MTTNFILAPNETFVQCPYNTSHQITNARFITHLEKCRKAYIKELTVDGRRKHMKICRYNALHHIPAPELHFHEERCLDSFSVVRHISYHNSDEGNRKYEERRELDSKSEWQEAHRDRDRDRDRGHHSSGSSRRHSHHSHRSHHSHHSHHSRSSSSNSTVDTKPINPNEWGLEEENWETDCADPAPGYDPEVKLKSEVVLYNPHGLTKSERKKFRNEVRQKASEMSLKGEPLELPTPTSFDVKPDIKDLKIKEEGRRSPPEPGEIEDDDDDDQPDHETNATSSGQQQQAENYPSHRNSHDDDNHHRPSSWSNSSSHHYQSTSKPSRRASGSTWTSSVARTKEEYYPDSDDFEGFDPFN